MWCIFLGSNPRGTIWHILFIKKVELAHWKWLCVIWQLRIWEESLLWMGIFIESSSIFFLHRIERWKIKTSKLKASHGIRGLYRCTIIVQQGGETKQSKGCKQVSCFGTKACPPRVCGGLTLVQNSRGTEQLSEICLTTSQTKQVLLSSFSRCVRNPYFPRTVLALL